MIALCAAAAVVTAALLLPPVFSQHQDGGLLGRVRTQAVPSSAPEPANACTVAERLHLLSVWNDPEQHILNSTQTETRNGKEDNSAVRAQLQRMQESGAFPAGVDTGSLSMASGEAQRMTLIDAADPRKNVRVSFYTFRFDGGLEMQLGVDADSGKVYAYSLYPDATDFAGKQLEVDKQALLKAFGAYLGVEWARVVPDLSPDAAYGTPEDAVYAATQDGLVQYAAYSNPEGETAYLSVACADADARKRIQAAVDISEDSAPSPQNDAG